MAQDVIPNIHFQNPTTFKQIVADHVLNIPHYQRGYSWGKAELHQLLTDVYSKMSEEDGTTKPILMSSIALCNAENVEASHVLPRVKYKDIIDGQQRLTSVSLVLAAIAREIGLLKLDEKTSTRRGKFVTIIEDFLFANADDMEKGSAITRIVHGDKIERKVYADLCYHEDPVPTYENDTDEEALCRCTIFTAYHIVARWIRQTAKEISPDHADRFSFLQTFAKMCMNGVYAAVVESEDSGTVIEFFQNINTKGLKLSQMDQVKTLFAQKIEPTRFQELWDAFRDNWRAMQTGVYKLRDDEILRLWLFTRTKNVVQKAALYATALHHLGNGTIAFDESCLVHLNQVAERLARYSQHTIYDGRRSDSLYRISLLSDGRSRQHIPVMLAAAHLEDSNPEVYERLLREIEHTIFVTITAHPSTGLYKQKWPEWASKAFDIADGTHLDAYLNATLRQARQDAREKFEQAFATMGSDSTWRNDRPQIGSDQRYALLVMAQKAEESMGTPDTAENIYERLTVEHILPARRDMAQRFGMSLEDYRKNLTAIGNLLPLTSTENSAASDRPLVDPDTQEAHHKTKMCVYKESKFSYTNITANGQPALAQGKAKGASFLKQIPVLDPHFTPQSIVKRGKDLAKLATEIWV